MYSVISQHLRVLYYTVVLVAFSPLDEVVEEVLDSLLQLRFLQRDWVTLICDLHHQFSQFVQLSLDLEEALCCQSEPEKKMQIQRCYFPLANIDVGVMTRQPSGGN